MASGNGAPVGTGGVGTRPAASPSSAAAPIKIRKKVNRRPGHEYADPGVQAFAAAAAQLDPAAAAASREELHGKTNMGADAAPTVQTVQPWDDFVERFYEDLNSKPHSLHLFYDEDAVFLWRLNGPPVKLKSSKEIKDYLSVLSKNKIKMKFTVYSHDALPIPRLNSALLMVNGTCQRTDNKVSGFVQSFVLQMEHSGLLILDDYLRLLENGSRVHSVDKVKLKEYCGLCKKLWHHTNGADWVLCDVCGVWLHLECVLSCGDLKDVKKTKYSCADCRSECEGLPALRNTSKLKILNISKKELPESIPVTCCGIEAFYLPDKHMMLCQCEPCKKTSMSMTPNEWENHTGSRKKNWKLCVKVKGTEERLDELLKKFKSSTASESHHTSTAMLKNKPARSSSSSEHLQSPTADFPGPKCPQLKNKAGKPTVCILEDNNVMSLHKSRKKTEHENAFRVLKILDKLDEDQVLDRVGREPFGTARRDVVLLVHGQDYLPFVDSLPMTVKDMKAKFPLFIGKSLFSSAGTSKAVYKAAGAVIRGVELVVEESYEKAFAIIRPPGHHADKRKAEGFCYLNNLAIGAQHLLTNYAKKRILLVDFDVHHGNGTQEIFYDSNEVLFFSTHRSDLGFPSSAMGEEFIGKGAGRGYNVNVPLAGSFGDKEFFYIWKYLLIPLATAFSPEIVLVSAGYDAGQGDPLGGCEVSPLCFGTIVHQLLRFGGGKMVLGLEGGYDLTQLPVGVSYTIRALLGDDDAFIPDRDIPDSRPNASAIKAVKSVKECLRPYWPGVFT